MDSISSFSLREQVSISGGDSNPDLLDQVGELDTGSNATDLLMTKGILTIL
jgi:hypothetical protein